MTTRFVIGIDLGTTNSALAFADTGADAKVRPLPVPQVDLAVWEVERFVVNTWESAAKNAEGEVVVTPVHQVKAWLRRRAS